MVTIVNYGLGNIQAFAHIYRKLNIQIEIAERPEQLLNAERIILPGVGAFDWAMTRLNESGLRPSLDYVVLEKKVPVLGVCVGMQMMANWSEEGVQPGLGWINGRVLRFDHNLFGPGTHLPHMGWNVVVPLDSSGLFGGIDCPTFYFLHSYYFAPVEPIVTIGSSTYGCKFSAAIRSGNIFGTQFHPEKSHSCGVALLNNFSKI